jgi:Family of unknown function (DUF6350)
MGAMTDLLSRPILRVQASEPEQRRPLVLTSIVATGWCVAVSMLGMLVLAVVGWFAGDTGSFGAAVRVGALAWLVGQGGALSVDGVGITAVPLGWALLCGLLLYRAGRWVAGTAPVRSLRGVGAGVATMAGGYVAAGLVVYLATRSASTHADLTRTLIATAVLAVLFGGLGILRGSGQGEAVLSRLPVEARSALTGGAAGAAAMVACSAVLLTGSLVVHFGAAVTVAEGMHSGLVGGIIVALVGAAAVPNAVLCAGAYMTGAGFTVGTGTLVAPQAVHVGTLPGFPLLAALPRAGSLAPWLQTALVLAPLAAGVVAGAVVTRRWPSRRVEQAVLRGALAGLTGGLGFGLLTALARGSVGPGRMQQVGPNVGVALLVCVVAFTLGGALAALVLRVLQDLRRVHRGAG